MTDDPIDFGPIATGGPSATDVELMWVAEVNLVHDLLNFDGVTRAGLDYLLTRYRHLDNAEQAARVGGLVPMLRSALLDRVARTVAGGDADLLDLFRGRGDLLDAAPDDLAGLVDTDDTDPAA